MNNAPIAVKPTAPRQLRRHRDFAAIVPPGTPGLDVVPAKGVHQYQCIFHPWMRTVVTVR